MTTLNIYENVLVELNKVEAPTILLSDFNYFLNKSIYQYANKKYLFFDMNQQNVDDLYWLVDELKILIENNKFELPEEYLHVLSISINTIESDNHCDNSTDLIPTIRTTHDLLQALKNNYYMRPSKKRAYHIIKGTSVLIECGNYKPTNAVIVYLRKPKSYKLTREHLRKTIDSEILEFPDYVYYEIINEIVKLVMENASDPRLQSHIPINQSISPPYLAGAK